MPLDRGPASQASVPRDPRVESPAGSGRYRKANQAYSDAQVVSKQPRQAANVAAKSLGAALGLPIHGWLTVDFGGFRELVDALGGVEVDVQRPFVARYPDPKRRFKWTTVRLERGPQEMDGERAIQYARARYVVGGDEREGSDFARAGRQQRLVSAIKRKLLSPAGLLRGTRVADAVEDEVRTNVSSGDLARVFRRGTDPKRSIVLSNSNVLVDGTSDTGQYILLPRDNEYRVIHRYVRNSLDGRDAARR